MKELTFRSNCKWIKEFSGTEACEATADHAGGISPWRCLYYLGVISYCLSDSCVIKEGKVIKTAG